MPRHGGKHVVLVKGAEEAMRAFKQEIAGDLGLLDKMGPEMSYKNLSTVEVGNIGGEMVRRMQAAGEYAILQRFKAGEKRLMPEEVLPAPEVVRSVSNNGNLVDESGAIIMDVDIEKIQRQLLRGAQVNNTPNSVPAAIEAPTMDNPNRNTNTSRNKNTDKRLN